MTPKSAGQSRTRWSIGDTRESPLSIDSSQTTHSVILEMRRQVEDLKKELKEVKDKLRTQGNTFEL